MLELNQSVERLVNVPLVTVAMPVFNGGDYLRLAVLSIVGQSFQDWELLIIDDGSTDDAINSIRDIKDARIKIISDGNKKGLAVRLNECINLARGKYFARMDHDDVSFPDRLLFQVNLLDRNPLLDVVATRAITIDEENRVTGLFPCALTHEEICARPWMGFYFPHPIWLGKIEWFRKYRYTVPMPYFCEDQELLLRSYRDSRFEVVDKVLFAYRVKSEMDLIKLEKTRWAVLKIQLKHFSKMKLWKFMLLSTVAFLGKMSGDILKNIRQGGVQRAGNIVSESNLYIWNEILSSLDSKSKVL